MPRACTEKPGALLCTSNPCPEEAETGDTGAHWASQTGQIGEPQASERHCLKTKQNPSGQLLPICHQAQRLSGAFPNARERVPKIMMVIATVLARLFSLH